jgi:hypothetical protein
MNRNLLLVLTASLYGLHLMRFEFGIPSFYMGLFQRRLTGGI